MRHAVYTAEKAQRTLIEDAKKTGGPIGKSLVIQNLQGVGMRNIAAEALSLQKELIQIISDNYPERLGVAYIINIPAPKFFNIGYNIVKHIFDENLKNKFQFLTGDWKAALREVVDEDQLPVYLGGTRAEPDEFCSDHLGVGGPVPESLFKGNDGSFFSHQIPARSRFKLEVMIGYPNSEIKWEFRTKDHDIKFGVFYLGSNEDVERGADTEETVLESKRYDHSSKELVKGSVSVFREGVYQLVWDNSYSMVRGKTLKYKHHIEYPEELREEAKKDNLDS